MNNQLVPEQQFIIDLVFKPLEPGLKLPLEEVELLLAYLDEILRELEKEELAIESEENSGNQ